MPKIAVLSDIHSNLQALEAVLEILDNEQPDEWICLGDLVGYGPNPSECVQLIMDRNFKTVLGNHDAGVSGLISLNHFRNPNRKLIQLSREMLSQNQLSWLSSLPYILEGEEWRAAHATPDKPKEWVYLDSAFKARAILKAQDKHICFVGHTHRPALISDSFGAPKYVKSRKYLINPGSVGQSRDSDYRASCCIVDTDAVEYKNFRIEYDVEPVLTSIMKLGFSRKDATHLMKV